MIVSNVSDLTCFPRYHSDPLARIFTSFRFCAAAQTERPLFNCKKHYNISALKINPVFPGSALYQLSHLLQQGRPSPFLHLPSHPAPGAAPHSRTHPDFGPVGRPTWPGSHRAAEVQPPPGLFLKKAPSPKSIPFSLAPPPVLW